MKTLTETLKLMLCKNECEKIPTGFTELDVILGGGLSPEGVTLVAGRPFMGKTSFLLDIAIHHAKTTGKKVAFFSFEDSEESVALSILGKASKNAKEYREIFSSQDLKRKIEEDGQDVVSAYADVKNLPIIIYWNPTISPFEIKEMCEAISQLGMIVIDSSRRFDMGQVTTQYLAELSQVAMSLHLPVVCSCNVNRSVEFHENHRPNFESIIGSGLRVGTPKPTIIALYREDYYRKEKKANISKHPAEAIVIPFWGIGEVGTANIIWNEKSNSFENKEEIEKKQEECGAPARSVIIDEGSNYNHWSIFIDRTPSGKSGSQSQESQYRNCEYVVRDSFEEAKAYFREQVLEYDFDGVFRDFWDQMEDWEVAVGVTDALGVIDTFMRDIEAGIEVCGEEISGEVYLENPDNGWETLVFNCVNSDYRFSIPTNILEMENPKDKYFFQVDRRNELTGRWDPFFYMQLLPSL